MTAITGGVPLPVNEIPDAAQLLAAAGTPHHDRAKREKPSVADAVLSRVWELVQQAGPETMERTPQGFAFRVESMHDSRHLLALLAGGNVYVERGRIRFRLYSAPWFFVTMPAAALIGLYAAANLVRNAYLVPVVVAFVVAGSVGGNLLLLYLRWRTLLERSVRAVEESLVSEAKASWDKNAPPRTCPHCGLRGSRFRTVDDAVVCLACGRSSPRHRSRRRSG